MDLVGDIPPLKKIRVKVSWDDDIPKWMEKQKSCPRAPTRWAIRWPPEGSNGLKSVAKTWDFPIKQIGNKTVSLVVNNLSRKRWGFTMSTPEIQRPVIKKPVPACCSCCCCASRPGNNRPRNTGWLCTTWVRNVERSWHAWFQAIWKT